MATRRTSFTAGTNKYVECRDESAPTPHRKGEVHMLVTGIDYSCDQESWAGPPPHGNGPLDTMFAFGMMEHLGKCSGAKSVVTLWNQQCTKERVAQKIHEVGGRCKRNDMFVFFYAGHGELIAVEDGHGAKASCLCLVDDHGNADDKTMTHRHQIWMKGSELASAITESVADGVQVLLLIDACHSGKIANFDQDLRWQHKGIQAISIAGSVSSGTAAGSGKGGIFTRAVTQAVQDLQTRSRDSYMVSKLYNAALAEQMKHHIYCTDPQQFDLSSINIMANEMVWPLKPYLYVAPPNLKPLMVRPGAMFKSHIWEPLFERASAQGLLEIESDEEVSSNTRPGSTSDRRQGGYQQNLRASSQDVRAGSHGFRHWLHSLAGKDRGSSPKIDREMLQALLQVETLRANDAEARVRELEAFCNELVSQAGSSPVTRAP